MPTAIDLSIEPLVSALAERGARKARLAFVLGSGLGAVAERLDEADAIPFASLPGMPASRVAGHGGTIHLGRLGGVPVLVQAGRVHRYEGWTAREVARSVRAYGRLGIRGVVLCNAAGGLRPEWPPGTLMRIVDQINLQGATPLAQEEARRGNPYDPAFGVTLERIARSSGLSLERGTYAGLLGPSYETAAEVRLLRALGADAVGMSTVAESQAAAASGARVAGLSLISNHAAGLAAGPLTHDEVLAAGKAASAVVAELFLAAAEPLAHAL
jgi:purine-nucleoside phosphorylase